MTKSLKRPQTRRETSGDVSNSTVTRVLGPSIIAMMYIFNAEAQEHSQKEEERSKNTFGWNVTYSRSPNPACASQYFTTLDLGYLLHTRGIVEVDS
jgi:hypothetical protein